MTAVSLVAGEVLKYLNLSRVRFHTFGCEDCTVKADFRLSDFTFVAIEDLTILS